MKEIERQTEIDQTYIDFLNALENYTESDYDDMWTKEHKQQHAILRYEDAYVMEDIWLEVIKTYSGPHQDKPTAYIEIDMVMSDMQLEFFSAAALSQDDAMPEEVEDLTEDQYWSWVDKQEKEDDEEREKWKDRESLEASILNEAIEIRPVVESRECYNNITHHHFYKAINVKARVYTTIELEKLKSFMGMREFFYSLGFNHFSKES